MKLLHHCRLEEHKLPGCCLLPLQQAYAALCDEVGARGDFDRLSCTSLSVSAAEVEELGLTEMRVSMHKVEGSSAVLLLSFVTQCTCRAAASTCRPCDSLSHFRKVFHAVVCCAMLCRSTRSSQISTCQPRQHT